MISPYERCPVLENGRYLLRLIRQEDAADLLCVYSDEKAWPIFNSDNCIGDFKCTRTEDVGNMIDFWLREYGQRFYVRWAIMDQESGRVIGTIELFNRQAEDYFTDCGLLRLDLRSDYEEEECIFQILSLIVPPTFELFDCAMMATKIPPVAVERMRAAKKMGFTESVEKLIGGQGGREYGDYWILRK